MGPALRMQQECNQGDIESEADDASTEQLPTQAGTNVAVCNEIDDERREGRSDGNFPSDTAFVGHEETTGRMSNRYEESQRNTERNPKTDPREGTARIEDLEQRERTVEIPEENCELQGLRCHPVEPLSRRQ